MKIMVPLFAYQSNGVSKPPRHHMYVMEYLAQYTTPFSKHIVCFIPPTLTSYTIRIAVTPFFRIFTEAEFMHVQFI